MIKLKNLIKEETKKRKHVNESNGDVEVELNGKQLQELDKIFDKFKSDLNQVVDVQLEEKELDYTKMSPSELEEVKGVLKVDGAIMDGIEELLELGGEAKTWYAEMNKTML